MGRRRHEGSDENGDDQGCAVHRKEGRLGHAARHKTVEPCHEAGCLLQDVKDEYEGRSEDDFSNSHKPPRNDTGAGYGTCSSAARPATPG